MFFGIIFSVLKGKKILGKLNLPSTPTSRILKKTLFGFALSREEPIFPLKAISKFSAPLNTFRAVRRIDNDYYTIQIYLVMRRLLFLYR